MIAIKHLLFRKLAVTLLLLLTAPVFAGITHFSGRLTNPSCGNYISSGNIILECRDNPATPDRILIRHIYGKQENHKGVELKVYA